MNSVLEKGEKQLLKVESKNGNMEIGNGNGKWKMEPNRTWHELRMDFA